MPPDKTFKRFQKQY